MTEQYILQEILIGFLAQEIVSHATLLIGLIAATFGFYRIIFGRLDAFDLKKNNLCDFLSQKRIIFTVLIGGLLTGLIIYVIFRSLWYGSLVQAAMEEPSKNFTILNRYKHVVVNRTLTKVLPKINIFCFNIGGLIALFSRTFSSGLFFSIILGLLLNALFLYYFYAKEP